MSDVSPQAGEVATLAVRIRLSIPHMDDDRKRRIPLFCRQRLEVNNVFHAKTMDKIPSFWPSPGGRRHEKSAKWLLRFVLQDRCAASNSKDNPDG